MKVALRGMRDKVEAMEPFKGNSVFARWEGEGVYVVYSYGAHFPMYANIKGHWYGNSDRYSMTTSRHQGSTRPDVAHMVMVGTSELRTIIYHGVSQ